MIEYGVYQQRQHRVPVPGYSGWPPFEVRLNLNWGRPYWDWRFVVSRGSDLRGRRDYGKERNPYLALLLCDTPALQPRARALLWRICVWKSENRTNEKWRAVFSGVCALYCQPDIRHSHLGRWGLVLSTVFCSPSVVQPKEEGQKERMMRNGGHRQKDNEEGYGVGM
eukprot:3689739-Rhodomonas_salina.1